MDLAKRGGVGWTSKFCPAKGSSLVYKIGKYGQIQSSYFGVLEFKK